MLVTRCSATEHHVSEIRGAWHQRAEQRLVEPRVLIERRPLGTITVVHHRYERITGRTPTIRVIMPWRRSLRGGRSMKRETDGRLPVNALDVIMVVSAVSAVVAPLLWLLIENPTPPNIGGPGPAKD